jgi:DNA methyltransferase 1-associated protein 1
VKETFNAAHETERKRALSALLSQTKQQERKDAEILAEAKRIMETRAASKHTEEAGALAHFDNVDGVSPLSNTHPLSTATLPAAAVNNSIPASLRMVTLKLWIVAFCLLY